MPLYPPPSGGGAAVTASASNGSFTAGLLAFSNANNVTFGTSAGSIITASVVPGAGGSYNILAAGTQTANTTGTVLFSNSNGITFGMNNSSVITASHNALTTAMASNRGTDFVQATAAFAGTNASGTIASNGISVSVAAPLSSATNVNDVGSAGSTGTSPRYAVEDHVHAGVVRIYAGSNTGNTSGNTDGKHGNWVIAGTNNVTISGSTGGAGIHTVWVSGPTVSNFLTTAMASNRGSDFVQATAAFAGTNASGTIASNGISVSVNPAAAGVGIEAGTRTATTAGNLRFETGNGITFGLDSPGGSVMTASHNAITTARASNDAVGLNTALTAGPLAWTVNSNGISLNASSAAGTTSGFAGNLISGSMTHNTAGLNLSLNHPAWLTTAMQSNAATISNIRVSAGTTSNLLSALTFDNANGITFGLNASTLTASHNGLTTAALSNHSHGNPQLNLTNLSGTTASNSAGFTLSLSAAAPGGGADVVASASNGSFSFTTLGFSNANNVTFGTSAGSIITASVAAPGAAAENNWMHALGANTAGNTTASGSTIGLSGINLTISGTNNSVFNLSVPATSSLSATGQVSLSTNGSTISIGVPNKVTFSGWDPYGVGAESVAGAQGAGTIHFSPLNFAPNFQYDRLVLPLQLSNASNSSNSFTVSMSIGIFTKNASSLSLVTSTSGSTNFSASGTAGSYSLWGGIRNYTIPMTSTLTEGNYWVGIWSRTTTGGGAGQTINQMLVSQPNSSYSGILGAASNATLQNRLGRGVYTVSFSTAMPNSFAFSQINGNSSIYQRPPIIRFESSTV